jgi:Zn-dependent protease with chaperone function
VAIADLVALPYHRAVVEHLQRQSPSAWRHFASDGFRAAQDDGLRLELLKTTYVLERASYPEIYALADDVAAQLGLGVPVALYQGPEGALNAALVYLPDVACVVFQGSVLDRLDPSELRALLAHELAHHRLWRLEGGAYLCAARVLQGLLGGQAQRSVLSTLRLYGLATELFCDRAALAVGSDVDAVVRCLVKVQTGIKDVVAADFLAQAQKVAEAAGEGSDAVSHPETYLRALALAAYAADGEASDPRVRRLVEGPIALAELDLLRREELTAWTRRLVDRLLQPAWFRTEAVLGHARLMFDDYDVGEPGDPEQLKRDLEPYGPSVLDYAAFVLLDFVAVDATLGDAALSRAHLVAEELGLHERLERELHKKLKRTKKALKDLLARRAEMLAQADAQPVAG